MIKLLSILLIGFSLGAMSCYSGKNAIKKIGTPMEFLSSVKVDEAIYHQDKLVILKTIQYFLSKHLEPFYGTQYFDSTILGIDTIFYNETRNKISVFVFTRNPTTRISYLDKNNKWDYNAFCFLGKRKKDSLEIKWFGRYSIAEEYDQKHAMGFLKDLYFFNWVTAKEIDKNYIYQLNMDDKRFWESDVWDFYFSD